MPLYTRLYRYKDSEPFVGPLEMYNSAPFGQIVDRNRGKESRDVPIQVKDSLELFGRVRPPSTRNDRIEKRYTFPKKRTNFQTFVETAGEPRIPWILSLFDEEKLKHRFIRETQLTYKSPRSWTLVFKHPVAFRDRFEPTNFGLVPFLDSSVRSRGDNRSR